MKIYYPVKPKLEYTARGESCFIKQDNIYYLRRPIEEKFYNGMTWENYGTKWRIKSSTPSESELPSETNHPNPATPLETPSTPLETPSTPLETPITFGLRGKPVLI